MKQTLTEARPQVVLAFMQRAAALTPKGKHPLIGRLGGPYPLKRFRHCDHLIAPTPGLVDHIDWCRLAARQVQPAGELCVGARQSRKRRPCSIWLAVWASPTACAFWDGRTILYRPCNWSISWSCPPAESPSTM